MAAVSEQMAIGENFQDEQKSRQLIGRYKELETQIPSLYEQWGELNTTLEEN